MTQTKTFTRTDLILQFAGEFGHGLQRATDMADAKDEVYVEWLEQIICDAQQISQELNQR